MRTPEGRLKDQVKLWLRRHGAYMFMPVQTGYGMQTLDFLCCVPYAHVLGLSPFKTEWRSRFVGIETKAPGKKATARQAQCIREIVAAGGAAFVCDTYEGFLLGMTTWGLIASPSEEKTRDPAHAGGE